ncbi:hypothetical protein Esti_005081 [Eimeria stiedai]
MPSLSILDVGHNLLTRIEAVKAVGNHLKLTQLNMLGNPCLEKEGVRLHCSLTPRVKGSRVWDRGCSARHTKRVPFPVALHHVTAFLTAVILRWLVLFVLTAGGSQRVLLALFAFVENFQHQTFKPKGPVKARSCPGPSGGKGPLGSPPPQAGPLSGKGPSQASRGGGEEETEEWGDGERRENEKPRRERYRAIRTAPKAAATAAAAAQQQEGEEEGLTGGLASVFAQSDFAERMNLLSAQRAESVLGAASTSSAWV